MKKLIMMNFLVFLWTSCFLNNVLAVSSQEAAQGGFLPLGIIKIALYFIPIPIFAWICKKRFKRRTAIAISVVYTLLIYISAGVISIYLQGTASVLPIEMAIVAAGIFTNSKILTKDQDN